MQKVVTERASV